MVTPHDIGNETNLSSKLYLFLHEYKKHISKNLVHMFFVQLSIHKLYSTILMF